MSVHIVLTLFNIPGCVHHADFHPHLKAPEPNQTKSRDTVPYESQTRDHY